MRTRFEKVVVGHVIWNVGGQHTNNNAVSHQAVAVVAVGIAPNADCHVDNLMGAGIVLFEELGVTYVIYHDDHRKQTRWLVVFVG